MVNHSGVWGLTGCAAFKNEMDIQARDQPPYYFRERERARGDEKGREGAGNRCWGERETGRRQQPRKENMTSSTRKYTTYSYLIFPHYS
jgi:hypothetical protein